MDPGDQRVASIHLDSGPANYEQHIQAGRHRLVSDEPSSIGGADAGPAPYALVLAGLAACTSITLRMYADRKGWELGPVHVDAALGRHGEEERVERTIKVAPALTPEQRAKLAEIAEKTPVTKSLKRAFTIVTTVV